MKTIIRRLAPASAVSLIVAAALSAPGAAQTTTETTVSYAADASSTGFLLAITPPDAEDPAFAVTAATTGGDITSDGPAASGFAEVAALADETAARAETQAPPDDIAQEQSSIPAAAVPLGPLGTVGVGAIQGEARSASEADDELPSTRNDASFSGAELDLGPGVTLPDPFGTVGGNVTVLGGATSSDAAAAAERDVAASAEASGLEISANLDIELLDRVCIELPPGPLADACQALAGTGQPAAVDVTLGSSTAECAWTGGAVDCSGDAAAATIEVLGQEPIEVAPGETVTIPPDPGPNDPFLVRVALGTVEGSGTESAGGGDSAGGGTTESTGSSASVVATGLSVELLGAAASGPGLVTLEIGESSAGLSARVASREIIARTGGTVLPLLLGGVALVAVAVGLRRYLRRA